MFNQGELKYVPPGGIKLRYIPPGGIEFKNFYFELRNKHN